MTVVEPREFDRLDISSLAFWSQAADERDRSFAELRRERPVTFHRPPEGGLAPPSNGFWALVRHEDVLFASRHPGLFRSGAGVGLEDVPIEMQQAVGSFLHMDAPRHTTIRRLISHAFTPRQVARIETAIRQEASAVVEKALTAENGDVVASLSTPLPLWTVSELLGIPREQRDRAAHAANVMVGINDPDTVPPGKIAETVFEAAVELNVIATELAAERRRRPQDDLMTALVSAEVDDERLTDADIAAFFTLLSIAGNDTTRNSISHGVLAFASHPEQWDLLRSDADRFLDSAVEEVVRWASPVMQFRRTAAADVELHGQRIRAGDWVVLFYASANRDDAVFPEPWQFDIRRSPNDHVGFGGGGPHFCLGASLARAQLRAVFFELAGSVAAFDAGPPQMLVGNFIHGVKRLPCSYELET